MKPEEQRIAIAEACDHRYLLDYLNDLNAMHEAIGTLLFSQRRAYRINLKEIMSKKINPAVICYSECIDAPAAQRAEAFLKTIGKWEGGSDE